MKNCLLAVGLLTLLVSCASVPTPEGPDDSLVVGYFALDFPDGFFNQGKRTITSGITLNFVNRTTGRKFWVSTSNGFYHFLSNGTDTYTFAGYKLQVDRAWVESALDRKFPTKPHSVVYLGHLTVVYSKPEETHERSMDMKSDYWQFKTSTDFAYKDAELQAYLRGLDPESPWLQYEVVR